MGGSWESGTAEERKRGNLCWELQGLSLGPGPQRVLPGAMGSTERLKTC